MSNWKEKYQQFHDWQQRPYQVAPMSEEEHTCATCQTQYVGNYCPRCGQSHRIGRYSFKNALLLFLDVWGLGNRGMFRTLRDLILRPGYMIRDYLSGMQMAYFPPFKMLFLLTTLSIIVAHGLNIKGMGIEERRQEALVTVQNMNADDVELGVRVANGIIYVQEHFPNMISLLTIAILTSLYYLFFRKSKNIPDLRFSEFLIAMVYTGNMLTIYEILLTFLSVDGQLVSLASVLTVIPLKQMSGFSWTRTILSMLSGMIIMMLLIIICVAIVVTVLLQMGVMELPE